MVYDSQSPFCCVFELHFAGGKFIPHKDLDCGREQSEKMPTVTASRHSNGSAQLPSCFQSTVDWPKKTVKDLCGSHEEASNALKEILLFSSASWLHFKAKCTHCTEEEAKAL